MKRMQDARLLDGAVDGNLARDVHHCREGLERDDGHRLEQLLVGPPRLAGLLVEVHRGVTALLDQRAEIAQQRRLARILGVPLAREGDLVDAQPRLARRARADGEPRPAAVVLGDGEADPLKGRERQAAVPELGAEPRVGAERDGRARQDAEEVGQLAGGGHRGLQQRK
jgi:hypothetical protein